MEKEILSDIGKMKFLFEYKRGLVVSEQLIVEATGSNPSELATKRQVAEFQDWLDINHPTWYNGKTLNRDGGWGIYGPFTKKSWENETIKKQYLEYIESKKPKASTNNTNPQPPTPPTPDPTTTTPPNDSQKIVVLTKGVKM